MDKSGCSNLKNSWHSLDISSSTAKETKKEVKVQSEDVKTILSNHDKPIVLMIIWHSSIHKITRIFTYVQRFISRIERRTQSSKVKQPTKRMLKRKKPALQRQTKGLIVMSLRLNQWSGLVIQSPYKRKIYTKDDFICTASYSETLFMNTRSPGISPLKMQATAAESRHNKTFSNVRNPLDQRRLVV